MERDLFAELQLNRRWRVRSERIEPIRVEAPPEPPEDPLEDVAPEELDDAQSADGALDESAPTPRPDGDDALDQRGTSRRPAARWRDVLRRVVSTFVEEDEGDDEGGPLAGAGGRATDDAPRPLPDAQRTSHNGRPPAPEDHAAGATGDEQGATPDARPAAPEGEAQGAGRKGRWRLRGLRRRAQDEQRAADQGAEPATPRLVAESELVAFVGALPRCGTTTALAGWALARAEGGEEVVVIDAHGDRPFLPVHLMGRVARQGWMDARKVNAVRLARYIVPVPGAERLRLMPLAWNPALEAPASHDIAARLPVAVEAAQRAGATAVAVDLGTFRPLCGQTVDARLQWAAREAGLLAVVAPNDVLGIDAAARMVVAARAEGARKVVLILVGGDAQVATAYQVQRMLASLEPPAVVDAVVPVPWEDAIQKALGRELTPLRVGALLPDKRRKGVA